MFLHKGCLREALVYMLRKGEPVERNMCDDCYGRLLNVWEEVPPTQLRSQ